MIEGSSQAHRADQADQPPGPRRIGLPQVHSGGWPTSWVSSSRSSSSSAPTMCRAVPVASSSASRSHVPSLRRALAITLAAGSRPRFGRRSGSRVAFRFPGGRCSKSRVAGGCSRQMRSLGSASSAVSCWKRRKAATSRSALWMWAGSDSVCWMVLLRRLLKDALGGRGRDGRHRRKRSWACRSGGRRHARNRAGSRQARRFRARCSSGVLPSRAWALLCLGLTQTLRQRRARSEAGCLIHRKIAHPPIRTFLTRASLGG